MLPYGGVKSEKYGFDEKLWWFEVPWTKSPSKLCPIPLDMYLIGILSSRGIQPYMGLYILDILAEICIEMPLKCLGKGVITGATNCVTNRSKLSFWCDMIQRIIERCKWSIWPTLSQIYKTNIPKWSPWWEESNEIHIRGSQMIIGQKWIFRIPSALN